MADGSLFVWHKHLLSEYPVNYAKRAEQSCRYVRAKFLQFLELICSLQCGDVECAIEVAVEIVVIANGAFECARKIFDVRRIDDQIDVVDKSLVRVARDCRDFETD